jgi:hypothetical protein
LEGEDRRGWVERFSQFLKRLPLTNDEFAAMDSHQRASDNPETAAWTGMARDAGFERADMLFAATDQVTGVYRFRH